MVRIVISEVLYGCLYQKGRAQMLQKLPAVLITDCNAFYNGVVKSQPSELGLEERRTAIDALALRQALEEGQTVVRWVHSHAQIADGMTKTSWQAFPVLTKLMGHQRWRLVFD